MVNSFTSVHFVVAIHHRFLKNEIGLKLYQGCVILLLVCPKGNIINNSNECIVIILFWLTHTEDWLTLSLPPQACWNVNIGLNRNEVGHYLLGYMNESNKLSCYLVVIKIHLTMQSFNTVWYEQWHKLLIHTCYSCLY